VDYTKTGEFNYSLPPPVPEVALAGPPQFVGEDAHYESNEMEIQTPLEMDSDPARGFAPHPAGASGRRAIHQSSVDAADINRSGPRDVLECAKGPAPLPLDRSAADS